MTDPISRLSRTLAALRQGGKTRSAGRANQGAIGPPAPADATVAQARQQHSGAEQLRADIARRIRAIEPGNPKHEVTAARIFIERVLLHELGSQLERSPQFHTIVADVQRAMEGDESIKRELRALMAELGQQ